MMRLSFPLFSILHSFSVQILLLSKSWPWDCSNQPPNWPMRRLNLKIFCWMSPFREQENNLKSVKSKQLFTLPSGTCCAVKGCGGLHSVKKNVDFLFLREPRAPLLVTQLNLSPYHPDNKKILDSNVLAVPHLPAVRVVPVEGEVVGEPGVDLVQAQLLPGSRCQSLASHHVRFRANRLKSIREATEYDNVDSNNNNWIPCCNMAVSVDCDRTCFIRAAYVNGGLTSLFWNWRNMKIWKMFMPGSNLVKLFVVFKLWPNITLLVATSFFLACLHHVSCVITIIVTTIIVTTIIVTTTLLGKSLPSPRPRPVLSQLSDKIMWIIINISTFITITTILIIKVMLQIYPPLADLPAVFF